MWRRINAYNDFKQAGLDRTSSEAGSNISGAYGHIIIICYFDASGY